LNQACCIVNGKKMVVDIDRHILTGLIDEEKITDMRCPLCDAPAHLVHDETRKLHFRAVHEPDCEIVKDGREHKAHMINDKTIIDDIDTILHHRDHAPVIAPGPKPVNKPGADHHDGLEDIDEIDTVVKYGTSMIHTVGGIHSYVLANGLDADLGNGMTGRDLFLTARSLRNVRRDGMSGTKIAITKRFSPRSLKHPLKVPSGYTCLSDTFATSIEDAVFFIVRLTRKDQNSLFQAKIMGSSDNPEAKDKHRNILLLGKWRDYPNNYYNAFIAEDINTHCYKFVNYRELR